MLPFWEHADSPNLHAWSFAAFTASWTFGAGFKYTHVDMDPCEPGSPFDYPIASDDDTPAGAMCARRYAVYAATLVAILVVMRVLCATCGSCHHRGEEPTVALAAGVSQTL